MGDGTSMCTNSHDPRESRRSKPADPANLCGARRVSELEPTRFRATFPDFVEPTDKHHELLAGVVNKLLDPTPPSACATYRRCRGCIEVSAEGKVTAPEAGAVEDEDPLGTAGAEGSC